MENMNIVLDFTQKSQTDVEANQKLAIMPEWLAKEAMIAWAESLEAVSISTIKEELVESIMSASTIETMEEVCLQFIQTRQLIKECKRKNWSSFEPFRPVEKVRKIHDDTFGGGVRNGKD
jgi:hypothetical protein